MAKRSARQKAREYQDTQSATVYPLFPSASWSPLDSDSRDRKYVKNIRAMSPTQQQLLDAAPGTKKIPQAAAANRIGFSISSNPTR